MIPSLENHFGKRDSLIAHILFELCLFRYLAQSTFFRDTLYLFFYREIVLGDWKLSTDPDTTGANVPSKITRNPINFLIHESYTGIF